MQLRGDKYVVVGIRKRSLFRNSPGLCLDNNKQMRGHQSALPRLWLDKSKGTSSSDRFNVSMAIHVDIYRGRSIGPYARPLHNPPRRRRLLLKTLTPALGSSVSPVSLALTSNRSRPVLSGGCMIRPQGVYNARLEARVTNPRKSSADVGETTARKRVREVEGVREVVSGGAVKEQLAREMRSIPRAELHQMFPEMGLDQMAQELWCYYGIRKEVSARLLSQIDIQSELQPMAVRTKDGTSIEFIPCAYLTTLRAAIYDNLARSADAGWLKEYGVKKESEKSSREVAAELLGTGHPPTAVKLLPCAYVSSLRAAIYDNLERSKTTNTLIWHNNTIPEKELWVKVGGDHGGGSFNPQQYTFPD
ncbi:hypothetical protein Bbelb_035410 [Branchiostoma belcheri]|nr:hypothetical protein Bbelb_035410 [Branchiostoma belcheri]